MNGVTIDNFTEGVNTHVLKNRLEYFKHITTFMFDVDGVMTDGRLQVTDAGDFLRTFHTKDKAMIFITVKFQVRPEYTDDWLDLVSIS